MHYLSGCTYLLQNSHLVDADRGYRVPPIAPSFSSLNLEITSQNYTTIYGMAITLHNTCYRY